MTNAVRFLRLKFLSTGWIRIIAVTVPVTDLTTRTVDEDLPAFSDCGLASGLTGSFLGGLQGGDAVSAFPTNRPLGTVFYNMNVL